jgi:TonB-linked SusC/RagA family outer membrane protein
MKYRDFKLKFRALVALLVMLVLSTTLSAQKTPITGIVKDASNGEAILGANIFEKGTSNGTITNFDGQFTLSVAPNATLVIKYVGYLTVEMPIAGKKNLVIQLKEDAVALGEVVAIGYGSQKKKEVTGSVASIKAEDFNAGIKTSPIGLLQGKVAGLNVIKTSSDPTNTGYNIQIRGFSTLDKGAGTSPLFIVDGIPVNNIDNISPDEIASMDVLKDGSAAAIYGTRGTNGVIIITTKRGGNYSEVAVTNVEYSGYVSTSIRNDNNGMATPDQFRNLSSISNGKVIPVLFSDPEGNTFNTDWMGALTRDVALTHNHNLAISGSAKDFNYRAAINFKNAEGIAKVSNRQEIIAKLAANQKALNGWLDLQYDFSYMDYKNDYFTGDFKQAAIMNPTYPIYDASTANGYYKPTGTGLSNPVENMNQRESNQSGNYFRGSIKASVNIKSIKGLKLSTFAALEEGDNNRYWYNGLVNTDLSGSGKAGRTSDSNQNKLFELTGDYIADLSGGHSLVAVAGFSYQNFVYDGSDISNKGFPTDDAKYFQIGNGDATKKYLNVSSFRNSNTLAAVFGRANYNYKDRYLASASVRREGSSRFGVNNKWGIFPALSLGWRITSEEFMKGVKNIDDLKLRIGYGVTGNNLASDLRSIAMMSNGGTFWYNGAWVYTYGVAQNENPDLRWEKKYEYNVGLDYSILKKRVYGSLDMYYRQTRDLLWDYEVPTPPYQFPTLLANAGQMDSYGVELALSAVILQAKNLTWISTPTIAFNQNTITKLSDPTKGFNYKQTTSGGIGENGIMNTNTQILVEGETVGTFYGYKFYGFKSDGTWMFSTPAGGFTSDPSENQRQAIGNAQPWFTYGWNNVIKYKNFDITAFFRGVVGNKILNVTRWAYGPNEPSKPDTPTESMNIFMKDVAGGIYTNKKNFSDYYLEDGSYLKLDNLTIGYSLPLKNNKYLQSLRAYVTGQNLLTVTAYSGQDPEVNTTSVWNSGIDYPSFYPKVATFLVGVNFSLK